jgi:hypothetical protein
MAEVAKPSAAASGTTSAESKSKTQIMKPEKPNEEEYKKGLATLEKTHKSKQDALVCPLNFPQMIIQ